MDGFLRFCELLVLAMFVFVAAVVDDVDAVEEIVPFM